MTIQRDTTHKKTKWDWLLDIFRSPNNRFPNDPTNEQICSQPAPMLLYMKSQFCSMLTSPIPSQNQISSRKININSCNIPNHGPTIIGFHIEPIPQQMIYDNDIEEFFKFTPVWREINNGNCTEFIADTINFQIYHDAYKIDPPPGLNCNISGIDILAQNVTLPNQRNFNHKAFQFGYLYDQNSVFMKAFIPYHDLLMIVLNSDYIGIVGARVSSGNVLAMEANDNIHISKNCNKNYFTYRLIGFNRIDVECLGPQYSALNKNNKRLSPPDEIKNVYSHQIPSEFFANPCPPMWYN
jgi:hypothetical protein